MPPAYARRNPSLHAEISTATILCIPAKIDNTPIFLNIKEYCIIDACREILQAAAHQESDLRSNRMAITVLPPSHFMGASPKSWPRFGR
jgi:hypothetical protein